jgi:hypothetical protein
MYQFTASSSVDDVPIMDANIVLAAKLTEKENSA